MLDESLFDSFLHCTTVDKLPYLRPLPSILMSTKIRLKYLQLSQLNNECLTLVGRSAVRALKAHNGFGFRVQDKDILVQISQQSKRTSNRKLRVIYKQLESEITKSVYESISRESNNAS